MTAPISNPTAPTSLAAGGAPSTEAQRAQLRQAAQAFEAIFLRQMIGSMRNARLAVNNLVALQKAYPSVDITNALAAARSALIGVQQILLSGA